GARGVEDGCELLAELHACRGRYRRERRIPTAGMWRRASDHHEVGAWASPMAAMWTCPVCGRRFAARNQTHACGRFDLRRHLEDRSPEVVASFERFRDEVLRCGPAAVLPERTRVAFQTRMSFAAVSLRTRWLD